MFTVCLFFSTRWCTMFAVCLFFFHQVVHDVYCVFIFLPPGGARCLLCVYFSSTRWRTMFTMCLSFFHQVANDVYYVFIFLPPGGAECLLCVYFPSTRWCTMAMSKSDSEIEVDPVSQENFSFTRYACRKLEITFLSYLILSKFYPSSSRSQAFA